MTVYAITSDLMDGSKIKAGVPGVRVVRPGADLDDAEVVLVDLGLSGALDAAVAHVEARDDAGGEHQWTPSEGAAGATRERATQRASSAEPQAPESSGWNWQASSAPRSTALAKTPP